MQSDELAADDKRQLRTRPKRRTREPAEDSDAEDVAPVETLDAPQLLTSRHYIPTGYLGISIDHTASRALYLYESVCLTSNKTQTIRAGVIVRFVHYTVIQDKHMISVSMTYDEWWTEALVINVCAMMDKIIVDETPKFGCKLVIVPLAKKELGKVCWLVSGTQNVVSTKVHTKMCCHTCSVLDCMCVL